jgi:DNA-binding transcriptional MerR regulator
MFGIGEFARYLGVSVRMLRHYDALGLLVPAHVDPRSGYRRYSADQLDRGNRLVALKELGFALEQIGPFLDARLSVAELRAMLLLRRAQVSAQIAADQGRLAEIERRLRTIENGEAMSHLEFVTKALPAVRIAELTGSVAAQPEIGPTIGPLFGRLAAALAEDGASLAAPALAWYRAGEDGMECAAAFPVGFDDPTPALARIGARIQTLPAVDRAVTVLHRGGMDGIGETWQALAHHLQAQGYQADGVAREVYLHMPMDDDPATWVTEIQQPIA